MAPWVKNVPMGVTEDAPVNIVAENIMKGISTLNGDFRLQLSVMIARLSHNNNGWFFQHTIGRLSDY